MTVVTPMLHSPLFMSGPSQLSVIHQGYPLLIGGVFREYYSLQRTEVHSPSSLSLSLISPTASFPNDVFYSSDERE